MAPASAARGPHTVRFYLVALLFVIFDLEVAFLFAWALVAREAGFAGVVVAGQSYGQGSSREHAALCPMYLGVRAVIARSIERIHQANLVNFGILPLTFSAGGDAGRIRQGDEMVVENLFDAIASAESVAVTDRTQGFDFRCELNLAPRQRRVLEAGGLLRYTRSGGQ